MDEPFRWQIVDFGNLGGEIDFVGNFGQDSALQGFGTDFAADFDLYSGPDSDPDSDSDSGLDSALDSAPDSAPDSEPRFDLKPDFDS